MPVPIVLRFSSWRLPLLALGFVLLALLSSDSALAQDAAGPRIASGPAIASSPQSGDTYRSGEAITVSLTFSGPVTVTGKPRLRLDIGGHPAHRQQVDGRHGLCRLARARLTA